MIQTEPKPVIGIDRSAQEIVTDFDLWYRSIAPNVLIEDVDINKHIDEVSDAVLALLDKEAPGSTTDKFSALIQNTTINTELAARRLSLSGSEALPVIDSLFELAGRSDFPSLTNNVKMRFFDLVEKVAFGVRDNPTVSRSTQIQANGIVSNGALSKLQILNTEDKVDNFDDQYINIVKGEAKWLSEHSIGSAAGDLFENYIICLARYKAWLSESNDSMSVMHATTRQDKPARRAEGGSGHAFAHDVHILKDDGDVMMLQCKWGQAAHEARRYDPSVDMIVETGESALMGGRDFKVAFEALWHLDKFESGDICDNMVHRYGIDALLERTAAEHTRAIAQEVNNLGQLGRIVVRPMRQHVG